MKHLAQIQAEFLKEARSWDKLTLEEQKAYLKRHPGSKRRLTARPKNKDKSSDLAKVFNASKMFKHGFEFDFNGRTFAYLNKIPATSEPVVAVLDKETKRYFVTYKESIVKSRDKTIIEIKRLANELAKELKSKSKKKGELQEGQRVNLKADSREGFPAESGVVYSLDNVKSSGPPEMSIVLVQVDKEYRHGEDDDGIREVSLDQIEVIASSPHYFHPKPSKPRPSLWRKYDSKIHEWKYSSKEQKPGPGWIKTDRAKTK